MRSHFGECVDCQEGYTLPRWHHRLRQSFLKEGDLCAERARSVWAKPELRRETDAASVGSAVHAAIEFTIDADLALVDALQAFDEDFSERAKLPNFVWVKYNEKAARNFGHKCVTNWYNEVRPTLSLGETTLEWEFTLPLIDDEHRLVEVNGTIDYFATFGGLKDWKTSGRGEYVPWEHKRWDTQATIYTYAAWGMGWVDTQPVPFELVVMHPRGVQRLMLERTTADWDWLAQRAEALAVLIEAELDVWPKNDNHALCSSKWCDNWNECRGLAMGPTWPS